MNTVDVRLTTSARRAPAHWEQRQPWQTWRTCLLEVVVLSGDTGLTRARRSVYDIPGPPMQPVLSVFFHPLFFFSPFCTLIIKKMSCGGGGSFRRRWLTAVRPWKWLGHSTHFIRCYIGNVNQFNNQEKGGYVDTLGERERTDECHLMRL